MGAIFIFVASSEFYDFFQNLETLYPKLCIVQTQEFSTKTLIQHAPVRNKTSKDPAEVKIKNIEIRQGPGFTSFSKLDSFLKFIDIAVWVLVHENTNRWRYFQCSMSRPGARC